MKKFKKVGMILADIGICGLIAIVQWTPWFVLGYVVKECEGLDKKLKSLTKNKP